MYLFYPFLECEKIFERDLLIKQHDEVVGVSQGRDKVRQLIVLLTGNPWSQTRLDRQDQVREGEG